MFIFVEGPVCPLTVVQENEALLLQANISFIDRVNNIKREAGIFLKTCNDKIKKIII